MTAYTFYIDSMVQDYQSIWDNSLADGDYLLCEKETRNLQDLQGVAIKKTIGGTLQ